MAVPIIIWFHGLFSLDGKILPAAIDIIDEQMGQFKTSGLLDAASEMVVGINGGHLESGVFVHRFIPSKATVVYHGAQCHNELRTMLLMEEWTKNNTGQAYFMYCHAKSATHAKGSEYGERVSRPWIRCMMKYCVINWRTCVADLDAGAESVGCHFMRNLADGTQNIWAGNVFWVTANFWRTLPSITVRDRIKQSGLDSAESRFESEVAVGNGARCPIVKEYLPQGGQGCP